MTPTTHTVQDASGTGPLTTATGDADYWYALIDEHAAAEFQNVTARKMQADRQKGGGPHFVRLSVRCIKYRRIDLRAYAEARLRASTSDPGAAAA